MKKMIWSIFFCLLMIPVGMAQQAKSADKKAMSYFQQAKEAYRTGKTDKALEWLEKAGLADREFAAIYLLQADIYHKKGEFHSEIQAIETALALDSLKNNPYYYFVLAEHYFDQAAYEKACQYYTIYLRKDSRRQAAQQALRQSENCKFAISTLKTQVRQPTEVYFQANRPVYWPALDVTGQTLLFTEQEGDHETMWMLKDSVRYPLNFETIGNYGAPSLTADGQMMYFSMNGGRDGFDIYVAYRLSDSSWSEPVNLGDPVNTEGWDAQPAISPDGTKLYFASTREGGRGGSDIWFSRLLRRETNGRQVWSQPRCLYFNTTGDEMAPFLYFDNKTLFFSSNGYPGMGRKDIYKVDVNEAGKPLNIGVTVNTQKDEFGFIVDGSGEWGYFSSDVSGKRCIYRYRLDERVACPPAAYVCFRTEDEQGNPVVPDRLTLVEVAQGDTLACYDRANAHGQMLACVPTRQLLLVSVIKRGYLYYSDTLQVTIASRENPQICRVRLKEIRKDRTLVLKGIFFDVDDDQLKPESYPELQQLAEFLRLNPEVSIEISGHTDNTGSDQHNYRLSDNRAFEVYKYLFLKHISKDRMTYKGYGKDQPLAPNDTEAGRAGNRRTEIRIR